MKFRDDKEYKYGKYTFERVRIVQGCLIYAVFIALGIIGIVSGEKTAIIFIGIIAAVFGIGITYYIHRLRSFKEGVKIGFLKVLTFPTSMVGW